MTDKQTQAALSKLALSGVIRTGGDELPRIEVDRVHGFRYFGADGTVMPDDPEERRAWFARQPGGIEIESEKLGEGAIQSERYTGPWPK